VFERFTDRARRVVALAQEEARRLNHGSIGTEHLLLGLVHEEEEVAARALTALGASLPDVRARVEAMVGKGAEPPTGHIPFTPRAKKAMELSLREAIQLGQNSIGTEHILLGLVREGGGVAAQVLQRIGIDLSRARRQVVELLGEMGIAGSGAAEGGGTALVESRAPVAGIEAEGPRCPGCRAPLEGSLHVRVVTTEQGGEHVEARVVYCGTCGAAIGVV
jgi:ATP-dependent Clp protease ATP-binding subunit ClpC